jgi:hypothetical protein
MFVGYAEYRTAEYKAYRVLLLWDTGKLQVKKFAHCTFEEHLSPTIYVKLLRSMGVNHTYDDDDDDDDWWYEQLVRFPVHAPADPEVPEEYEEVPLQQILCHSAREDCDIESIIHAFEEDADITQSDHALHGHHATGGDLATGGESAMGGESIDGDEIAGDSARGDATATTEPVGPAGGRWPGKIRKEPYRFAYNVKGVSKIGTFDWPAGIQEALKREDADLWVEAINSELRCIFERQVYEEGDLTRGKKALSTQMVLNIKRDQFDNITKYKARLVARG